MIVAFALKRSSFKLVFDNVLRNEDLLADFFNHSLYSSRSNYLLFTIPLTSEVFTIVKHIFIESYSPQKYSNEICCNYISIFFALVMRNYSNTYLYYADRGNSTAQLPAILTYIKYHYRKVTLAELADFFNYDRAYLGEKIKDATGKHFNDIVTELKMKEARRLLSYTDKSIESIAEEIGYNSTDHFSRTFKKSEGMSPRSYRIHNKPQSKK